MSFDAPPDHVHALGAFQHWLTRKERPQVFHIVGPAGTGKTSLARTCAARVDGDVAFIAPSGKAAMALRARGSKGATTIHSCIYRVEDPRAKNPKFVLRAGKAAPDVALFVLDEASMVDRDVGRDLLSLGIPILALGDKFQLPSIDGFEFFMRDKPDVELTTILRQEQGSGVLELATRARARKRLLRGEYRGSVVKPLGDLNTEDLLRAAQILVGTNKLGRLVNREVRNLLGFTSPFPQVGDRLICLRTNKGRGLINGSLWRVLEAFSIEDDLLRLKLSSDDFGCDMTRTVKTPAAAFLTDGRSIEHPMGCESFGFAYAISVHKAQGSQWPSVLVVDDGAEWMDRDRWSYTALTRASERVTFASETIPVPW